MYSQNNTTIRNIGELEKQLNNISKQINDMKQRYTPQEKFSSEITRKTKINELRFTDKSVPNKTIITILCDTNHIYTVGALLDFYSENKLIHLHGIGYTFSSIIETFIKKNHLLSLKPENITDLYSKIILTANGYTEDFKKMENIHTSLMACNKYISAISSNSEEDFSQISDKITDLLANYNTVKNYIIDNIYSLKSEIKEMVKRAKKGEFIELPIHENKLIGTSQPDRSTEAKQKLDCYRAKVKELHDRYLLSKIDLSTCITDSILIKSKKLDLRERKILSSLITQNSSPTLFDLLYFYISKNNPLYIFFINSLNDNAINQIEMFIQETLFPAVFTKELIVNNYGKVNYPLLEDINTIKYLLNELIAFETRNDENSKYLSTRISFLDKYLLDPIYSDSLKEIRHRLNIETLYNSYVIDLISDCKNLLDQLNKIQSCLKIANSPNSNPFFKEYLNHLSPRFSPRPPGGQVI